MNAERRKKAVLAILLVVLAWALVRQFAGSDGGTRGKVEAKSRRAATTAASEVLDLDVAALGSERAVYAPGRDPFRYGPGPTQQAAQAPPEEREATAVEEDGAAEEARRRRAKDARPPEPRAPQILLQYLGSFGSQENRIAVFLDGEEIINAKLGDVLKGQFIVQGIGFESADLGFVAFPDEPSQRLPAGG